MQNKLIKVEKFMEEQREIKRRKKEIRKINNDKSKDDYSEIVSKRSRYNNRENSRTNFERLSDSSK